MIINNQDFLFRGKTESGEWVFGLLIATAIDPQETQNPQFTTGIQVFDDENKFVGVFKVKPETVSHYSGSEDNVGKMVFGGDILIDENEDGEVWLSEVVYSDIYSHDCLGFNGFKTERSINVSRSFERFVSEEDLEFKGTPLVIGNIHDNPEYFDRPIKSKDICHLW